MRRYLCALVLASAGFIPNQVFAECERAAPAPVVCESPCVDEMDCCCCDSWTWYFQADAIFLKRSNGTLNETIVLNETTGLPVISTGDFDFDAVVGPRFTVGRAIGGCSAIELSYFGLHDWSEGAVAVGSDNLSIPGDLGLATLDFLDADVMNVTYGSEIHNAEANLIHGVDGIYGIAGFRYFRLEEDFNINSLDLDTGTSDYNIRTTNNLYGFQLGAKVERQFNRVLGSVTGKAGIYGNDASQRTFVGDFDNSTIFRDSLTSQTEVAFVGDLVFNVSYALTDIWSIRGGYNLMWVDGVALAPSQLDFTNTPTSGTNLTSNDTLFFHGAHVGLEARW